MAETTNGDVTLHYEDEGSGPPILLIHGHTLDGRMWAGVVPLLLDAGLRVLRLDLRGHGQSTRPDSGYHLSHHAGDLAAVLDAAGIDRACAVGHSIGGAVAIEAAVTMPERIQGLVLVSPVMPDRPFEPEFMDNLRQVAKAIHTEGIEAAMAGPWAGSPLFAHAFSKPGVREAVSVITRDFPGAEYLASQRDRVERSWTMPDRLGEIRVPTAVLVGERETPGFRAFAEEAGEGIPDAALVVIEDGGHLLPLENPERVVEAIIDVSAGNDV